MSLLSSCVCSLWVWNFPLSRSSWHLGGSHLESPCFRFWHLPLESLPGFKDPRSDGRLGRFSVAALTSRKPDVRAQLLASGRVQLCARPNRSPSLIWKPWNPTCFTTQKSVMATRWQVARGCWHLSPPFLLSFFCFAWDTSRLSGAKKGIWMLPPWLRHLLGRGKDLDFVSVSKLQM